MWRGNRLRPNKKVLGIVSSQERLTSESFSLHKGQCGAWSRQRSRHFRQNVCPQGVVTGSKSNLEKTSGFSARNVQKTFSNNLFVRILEITYIHFPFVTSLILFLENKSIVIEIYVISLTIKSPLCLGYKIQKGWILPSCIDSVSSYLMQRAHSKSATSIRSSALSPTLELTFLWGEESASEKAKCYN